GTLTERAYLVTLPDFRQPVHTCTRLGEPSTRARTRWMFGFQRRFVRRWECDTDMPQERFLPHTSHTEAMVASPVVTIDAGQIGGRQRPVPGRVTGTAARDHPRLSTKPASSHTRPGQNEQ